LVLFMSKYFILKIVHYLVCLLHKGIYHSLGGFFCHRISDCFYFVLVCSDCGNKTP
jgi:hypothetical protein